VIPWKVTGRFYRPNRCLVVPPEAIGAERVDGVVYHLAAERAAGYGQEGEPGLVLCPEVCQQPAKLIVFLRRVRLCGRAGNRELVIEILPAPVGREIPVKQFLPLLPGEWGGHQGPPAALLMYPVIFPAASVTGSANERRVSPVNQFVSHFPLRGL
jgi:hypothetical protein